MASADALAILPYLAGPSYLAIQPKQTGPIFGDEIASLLKKAAGMALSEIDPRMKTAFDVAWIGIDIAGLLSNYESGEKENKGLFFKTAGIALGSWDAGCNKPRLSNA